MPQVYVTNLRLTSRFNFAQLLLTVQNGCSSTPIVAKISHKLQKMALKHEASVEGRRHKMAGTRLQVFGSPLLHHGFSFRSRREGPRNTFQIELEPVSRLRRFGMTESLVDFQTYNVAKIKDDQPVGN